MTDGGIIIGLFKEWSFKVHKDWVEFLQTQKHFLGNKISRYKIPESCQSLSYSMTHNNAYDNRQKQKGTWEVNQARRKAKQTMSEIVLYWLEEEEYL